jgi:hypothetical protein
MTAADRLLESALKPGPPAFTSDAAVREALTRYLSTVANYLHGTGHRVSGPTLAPPGERLAGTCTLTATAASGDANLGLVVASWNEEPAGPPAATNPINRPACDATCISASSQPQHWPPTSSSPLSTATPSAPTSAPVAPPLSLGWR